MHDQYREMFDWLGYFQTEFGGICASELLKGAQAAMLESVAYVGIGLGRAAITSLRTVVDLTLGYLFFCKHPVEWTRLEQTGDGYYLKSDIDKYCQSTIDRFRDRSTPLEQAAGVTLASVYKILSAHVHGQSSSTIPRAGTIVSLVSSRGFLVSICELQNGVVISLSNYLVAACVYDPVDLPSSVRKRLRDTLTPAQYKVVFP
jgi:hypothetical protein